MIELICRVLTLRNQDNVRVIVGQGVVDVGIVIQGVLVRGAVASVAPVAGPSGTVTSNSSIAPETCSAETR